MRSLPVSLLVLAVLAAAFGVAGHAPGSPPALAAAPPSPAGVKFLSDGVSLYPRLVRLEHQAQGAYNGRIIASVVTFLGNEGLGAFFESRDDGLTFKRVSTLADPGSAGGRGLCCSTLFELPRALGRLPAGTLLWAASAGQDAPQRRMSLPVWASRDQGRHWTRLGACARAAGTAGLWEPEFSVAADGALVCHYSDEGDAAHSQKLARVRSYDGLRWQDASDTVTGAAPGERPGMATVRRLADGSYLMAYELCGAPGQYNCAAQARASRDGWNWGDPAAPGARVEASDGRYFTHAPTLNRDARGRLYLIGQILNTRDGGVAGGNGRTAFTSTKPGGPWTAVTAPVPVPDAYDNYCPNYSSALLPSLDGRRLLEVATNYDLGTCRASFGRN